MKTSLWTIFTAALVFFGAVYCTPADDLQKLTDRVDGIEGRVATLEEQVKQLNEQTIPGLQSLVNAITTDNVWVTAVVQKSDGYEIKFSDGNSVVVKDGKDGEDGADGQDGDDAPVVNIALVDGNYVWTINGEVVLGEDGKPLRVVGTDGTNGTNGITPQFGIQDGHWIVSYDNGETWQTLGLTSNTDYTAYLAPDEETDDYIVLYVRSTRVEIPKEKTFTLSVTVGENNGVTKGQTVAFPYTITGVAAADVIDVDVIGASEGWDAVVVATDNASGSINVTNNSDGNGKVTVYAANHKGKSDIRTLKFEGGQLAAVIETQAISSNGGDMALEVTTNVDYSIEIPAAAQSWISCTEVKSVHTDKYTITVAANETAAFRSATVKVVDATGASIKDIEVFQYQDASQITDLSSVKFVKDGDTVTVYKVSVVAASAAQAIVTDSLNFIYINAAGVTEGVYNVTGCKKTNAAGGAYLDNATVTAVDGAEAAKVDNHVNYVYYGFGASGYTTFFTVNNGTVSKEGDTYYVTGYADPQRFVIENANPALNLDSFVDKFVAIKGWVTYVDEGADGDKEDILLIPTSVREIVYTEETGWELYYGGETSGESGYPELIGNNVANPSEDDYYQFAVYKAAAVEKAGSVDAFVKNVAYEGSDELLYNLTYYTFYGYDFDFIFSVFAHNDSATDSFSKFEYGTYYIVAFGLDADGALTGKYAVKSFEKKTPYADVPYSTYIGTWDTGFGAITVSEKENGKTYNVTGMTGQDTLKVEAVFEEGQFALYEQFISSDGVNDTYLCGLLNGQYIGLGWNTDAINNIYTVGILDGVATITNGSYSSYSVTASRFVTFADRIGDIEYDTLVDYTNPQSNPSQWITYTPSTTEYSAFIGKFQVGDQVWTISEKVNGESYNVDGIPSPFEEGKTLVGIFTEDKKFAIKEQSVEGTATSSYGSVVDLWFGAQFSASGKNYWNYPVNADEPAVILTFSEKNGEYTIKGEGWKGNSAYPFKYGYHGTLGEDAGDYAGYTLNYTTYAVPGTISKVEEGGSSKASVSSVKNVGKNIKANVKKSAPKISKTASKASTRGANAFKTSAKIAVAAK